MTTLNNLLMSFGASSVSETEEDRVAAELMRQGMSRNCALDVAYLRTRSRHTPELEARLIASHKAGRMILICDWPDHEDGNYDPLTGQSLATTTER